MSCRIKVITKPGLDLLLLSFIGILFIYHAMCRYMERKYVGSITVFELPLTSTR